MLKAYFDDSGRGQDPVLVLAGFLSTAERWAAFNEDWHREVNRELALGRFKMQHAMTGSDRWRLIREGARLERLDRFHSIIHRHVLLGFACVVRHDAYNRLMRDRLNFSEPAYWLGFIDVIRATMRYHKQAGLRDKVDFVFDKQMHEFKRALDSFRRLRRTDPYLQEYLADDTPREATDGDELPLQASDYLAWQMRRVYADQANPAAARRLAIFPPGSYFVEESDIPIMTDVIDAALLQQLGDERLTEDLATLERKDLPTRIKDYVRRSLTDRLRGEPEPSSPAVEDTGDGTV